MQWYRVDLHLHTPASADYIDRAAGFIDILRKAEARNLDIIALTDHNTVAGYAAMMKEIDRLNFLHDLGRAQADELRLLAEYRRLLEKILVLPGFEFTATFGFHILGIFSPETSIRQLEHLLLSLNIPPLALDMGSSEVGASTDVLNVYRTINEAGGICIAAHANSTHGVAMVGLDFGGQTRIAYTQDRYLHALEVTDLGRRDRKATQRFFDGTKPEYPRAMRCIQGSDAHSLLTTRDRNNRVISPGVGERVTELQLAERSFDALLEMFQSTDLSRSRLYNANRQPDDYVQSAREEGETLVQSFHESMERKGGRLAAVVADVCAMANTNGGTIYVGLSADKKKKVVGVEDTREATNTLQSEISQSITPTLNVEIDTLETQGKAVIRVQVPFGEERPYAIEHYKIYVRDDAETTQAVRDEIVNLVRQGLVFRERAAPPSLSAQNGFTESAASLAPPPSPSPSDAAVSAATITETPASNGTGVVGVLIGEITPPRAGVEIVEVEPRGSTRYYTMRDLRNGNVVRNVTMSSARRLWHYAIKQRESTPLMADQITWLGDAGLWKRYKKNGDTRYDLVQRVGDDIRVYYGVTENGMHEPWSSFLDPDDRA